jgi:hypothetical protein
MRHFPALIALALTSDFEIIALRSISQLEER